MTKRPSIVRLGSALLLSLGATLSASADSGFWPGKEVAGHRAVVDGVVAKPFYGVHCALNAPADKPDYQQRIDYVRGKKGEQIEAVQFKNVSVSLSDGRHLDLAASLLLLRCDAGALQDNADAEFHWQAFVPASTEALLIRPTIDAKSKTLFVPYVAANNPGNGARAAARIDLIETLRDKQLKALDAGQEVEFSVTAHHAYTKDTKGNYDRSSTTRYLFTPYSAWAAHMKFTLTLKKVGAKITLLRKRVVSQ